jgi:hypothetical protein
VSHCRNPRSPVSVTWILASVEVRAAKTATSLWSAQPRLRRTGPRSDNGRAVRKGGPSCFWPVPDASMPPAADAVGRCRGRHDEPGFSSARA